jgi:hypothetical protein
MFHQVKCMCYALRNLRILNNQRGEVMFLRRLLLISLLAASNTVLADTIDISLRDSSAYLKYSASMGRDTLGKSELFLGALYSDKDNFLTDIGLLVQDEVNSEVPIISAGFGIKALSGKARAYDVASVAIGAMVGVRPFADPRVNLVGEVFVSPKILSFGEATRYIGTAARAEFEIIPQAVAYVGYRSTRFDLKTQPFAKIDDGLHVGLRMMF